MLLMELIKDVKDGLMCVIMAVIRTGYRPEGNFFCCCFFVVGFIPPLEGPVGATYLIFV